MKLEHLKNHNTSLLLIDCTLKEQELTAKILYCREKVINNLQYLYNKDYYIEVVIPRALINRIKPYTGILIEPFIVKSHGRYQQN